MMTPSPFPRGSEWRIWDLHVHTPASSGFRGTFEDLIATASKCEAAVIGINDYATLGGYLEIMEKGGVPERALLPIVELRMHNIITNRKSAQAGALINFHLIFNNDDKVFGRALNFVKSLKCYNSKGDNDQLGNIPPADLPKVTFDIDTVINSLTEVGLRDETLIWLPYDEYGGIDDIDPEDNFFKLNLVRKADLIGSSNPRQIDFFLWKAKKFPLEKYAEWFDKPKPCLKGSDSHESSYPIGRLKDRDSKPIGKYCWIKSDPTFQGLKQVVHEPENRIYIGQIPPKLQLVRDTPEQFVDSIKIATDRNNNEWFDEVGHVDLNADLVSIIGNKGNGKSAFADIVASAGNSNNSSFSFLKEGKFLAVSLHLKYGALLSFRNGGQYKKQFSSPSHDPKHPSKVIYLSQSFVADLCEAEDTTRLQEEIDRVVYSHIPVEERLVSKKLSDMILLKTKHLDGQLANEREKLHGVIERIVELEEYRGSQFRDRMLNSLREKENELKFAQVNEKPIEIKAPDKIENAEVATALDALAKEQKEKLDQLGVFQQSLNQLVSDRNELTRVTNAIIDLKRRADSLEAELLNNAVLRKYGIEGSSLLKIHTTTNPLVLAVEKLDTDLVVIRQEKTEAETRAEQVKAQATQLQQTLGEKERLYRAYLEAREKWLAKQQAITGNRDTPDTIGWFKAWIDYIDRGLAADLRKAETERDELARNIVSLLFNRSEALEEVYSHAERFANERGKEFEIPQEEFIGFDSSVRIAREFEKGFLELINQNRKGTFYGIDEGKAALAKILNGINTGSIDSVAGLPNLLIGALVHNRTIDPDETDAQFDTDLDNQVLSKLDLYDYIFSFTFLTVKFDITYAGKRILNLSPGERGTLLLIFYLLIDKDLRPIIIDQPEENLDNETVYTRLVPFLRKAKNERQVIIVTHNPNLAVVCDSEQIIHCSIEKENANLVRYTGGSIEYSEIRNKAIDVLEGTEPAFKNRQDKYAIE